MIPPITALVAQPTNLQGFSIAVCQIDSERAYGMVKAGASSVVLVTLYFASTKKIIVTIATITKVPIHHITNATTVKA